MGLFDFLKSKKDEDTVSDGAQTAVADAPSTPASESPAPGESGFYAPAPHASTFVPPEAWNTESLTAPHPAPSGETPQIGPVDPTQTAALQQKIIDVMKTVFDPEIPVDIYELGLIYDIIVDAERRVLVKMTLTSPACPSAQQLPSEVRYKVKAVEGVTDAWVEIVWEPPWDKDRMSEAAKLSLGFF
jgi:FeS assembly SUF system protein